MPNYCNYYMQVRGDKEELEDFIKTMQSNYNYQTMEFDHIKHMGGRVFEAKPDCEITKELGYYGNMYNVSISGDCAWSVACCMLPGPFSYYNDLKKSYGEQSRSTTLLEESKHLKSIEVFSDEPGMGFQEHYFVQDGQMVLDNCDEIDFIIFETEEEALEFEMHNSNVSGMWEDEDGYHCEVGPYTWDFGNVLNENPISKTAILRLEE